MEQNSKVKTKSGKKILKKNTVEINGEIYALSTKPPEAVFSPELNSYEIFNEEIHVQPIDNKQYRHKKYCNLLITEEEGKLIYTYFAGSVKYKSGLLHPKFLARTSSKVSNSLFGTNSTYTDNGNIFIEKFGLYLNYLEGRYIESKDLHLKTKRTIKEDYIEPIKKIGLPYSLRGTKRFMPYNLGESSPSYRISQGLKYTFGVEIETSSGMLFNHDYVTNALNLECTHDGSISGGEYVTGVLTGDAGFRQLYKSCKIIQERCKIDKKCGIHVHIGGAVFNKEFSVLSYLLGTKLQEDLFRMLPKSRRGNKYCGDLPDLHIQEDIKEFGYQYGIQVAYENLFMALSNGQRLSKSYNKKNQHPQGRYCGQYHDVQFDKILRYKWLNLVPCNFNVRGYDFYHNGSDEARTDLPFTIEFRNHSASMNYIKIKNWVLICMAFVNYVENNKLDIINKKSITVEDILFAAYGSKAYKLVEYVQKRKSLFLTAGNESKEYKEEKSVEVSNLKEFICV